MKSIFTKKGSIHGVILGIIALLLAILIVSILILSWVPPVGRDALTHHLAVPKLYLKHGGMIEIPFMSYSYYPMNLDLLYLIPLYFGNDILPKFIHFAFALLSAGLVFHYLNRRLGLIYAVGGALFFLSIPIIVKLSITAYVDLGVVFFTTACLLLLFRWMETGFRVRYLIISGGLCGLAMGTKYNALIVFLILALFVPFLYSRLNRDERVQSMIHAIGHGVTFSLSALLVFSPWMIRNYIWTGNPVFPLYDQWFNAQSLLSHAHTGVLTFRSVMYGETWWEIALLPFRVFFEGKDGNPQLFDGRLNPFLLILTIFAFFSIKGDSKNLKAEKVVLTGFSALYLVFACFTVVLRIRYLSPIIIPMVILCVYGIRNMVTYAQTANSRTKRQVGMVAIGGFIAAPLAFNAVYVHDQYDAVRPFSFLMGKISKDDYISRYCPEYPVMKYINDNLPGDSRILFLYIGNRGYYCDRDYVFDMRNRVSTLKASVKKAETSEAIVMELKRMGITHLLIRFDIFKRWITSDFSEKEKKLLLQTLRTHMRHRFTENGFGLFSLG